MKLSAVVGKDPPPSPDAPSCQSPNGFASYGLRYITLANDTDGLIESICEQDFAPIVTKLGLTLSGLEADFGLSRYPKLDTLEVKEYATQDLKSLVKPLQLGVDYTYIGQGNKLHFEGAQVPPSQYWIVATYVVAPDQSHPVDTAQDTAQ